MNKWIKENQQHNLNYMTWFSFLSNNSHLNLTMSGGDDDSKLGEFHNCTDNSCDGATFNGKNFICSWCQQPSYLSCLVHRDEFKCIVNAVAPKINISSPSLDHCKIIDNAFNLIFQPCSTIDFICVECKAIGTFKEIEKEHEDKLINAKKSASVTLVATKQQHAESMESLRQQHSSEIEVLSQQLTQANDKLNELKSKTNDGTCMDDSDLNEKTVSMKLLVNNMIAANKTQLEYLQQLTLAMDSIQNKNLVGAISQIVNEEHSSARGGLSIEPQPEKRNNDLLLGTGLNGPQIVGNLQPPLRDSNDRVAKTSNDDNVLGIYISKFQPNTTCEDIKKHISKTTNVASSDFSVSLLANKRILRSKHLTYVSFKVSTSIQSVYDTILNEQVWHPHFSAVPFSQNQKNQELTQQTQIESNLKPPSSQGDRRQKNTMDVNKVELKSTKKKGDDATKSKTKQHQKRGTQVAPASHNCSQNKCSCCQDFCRASHQFSPHSYHQMCQQHLPIACPSTNSIQQIVPVQNQHLQTGHQFQPNYYQQPQQLPNQQHQYFGQIQFQPKPSMMNNHWHHQMQQQQQQQQQHQQHHQQRLH